MPLTQNEVYLGNNVLTVGRNGRFGSIQDAIDYIQQQPTFIQLSQTAVATSWNQNTSILNLSNINPANFYPHDSMWLKIDGDTYYYPTESSSGTGTGGVCILYPAMNRIEANLAGPKNVAFYRENQYTILLLDNYYEEGINITSPICVIITSKNNALVNLTSLLIPGLIYGRLQFNGVRLYNGATPAGFSGQAGTAKLVLHYTEINSIAADFFSPQYSIGSVEANFLKFIGSLNGTRGHLFNFRCVGDQKFKSVIFDMPNNAALSSVPIFSNFYFVDRFTARKIFIDNVSVIINDPHGDMGYATIVGAGTAVGDTISPYIYLNNITLNYQSTATPTMLLQIISLADGSGTYSGGIIDINNCCVIAPRGTSTRKLVQALADPGVTTVNYGLNPLGQPMDARVPITYTPMT